MHRAVDLTRGTRGGEIRTSVGVSIFFFSFFFTLESPNEPQGRLTVSRIPVRTLETARASSTRIPTPTFLVPDVITLTVTGNKIGFC